MTSTCWSPFPVPRSLGAPFPRSRKIVPDCVPAGTFNFTLPCTVGTSTSSPRAA